MALAISPDSQWVASAGTDKMIRVWDLKDGMLHQEISVGVTPCSVTFSLNGMAIIGGEENGTLKMWKVSSGDLLTTIPINKDPVNNLVFTPDGKALIVGSRDTRITIFPVEYQAQTKTAVASKSNSRNLKTQ